MSRQTPFQDKHAVEYGFQPVQRLVGDVITTVQCLFCVHIGRKKHEGFGVKCQCTKFQFPFRPEAYKNHHEFQHHEDWTSYQLLSHQKKAAFFKKKEVFGIHSFLDKDKDSLQFVISRPTIVDDVVGDLFFHPEEDEEDDASEPITKANAMKLFKPQEDGSYLVTIKNFLRFDLAIWHFFVGLSFQQTSKVIEQHRSATKNAKLSGLNNHMVGQFVRVLLTISLQIISNVLTNLTVWAFSLAADASTHLGVPLFDQRIRVCVKGVFYNLHFVLVPFLKRHTAQNYMKLIKILLNTVSPSWCEKIISISSDGENIMIGRHAGVVTLMENECSNHVFRIWCIPHQLDIVVKNATHGVLDEAFYKVAHAFSVHLRAQQILIIEMGSKCPKDTTRWAHSAVFYTGFWNTVVD
jgi:hypothetical protein